jgi:hypothetical protein
MTVDNSTIAALIPLIIIQIGLQIYTLYDIYKRGGAKGNTVVWVVIVALGQLLGPILYFVFGRKEEIE